MKQAQNDKSTKRNNLGKIIMEMVWPYFVRRIVYALSLTIFRVVSHSDTHTQEKIFCTAGIATINSIDGDKEEK